MDDVTRDSQRDGIAQIAPQSLVAIVGPDCLLNESLAFVLEKEVCERCVLVKDITSLPQEMKSKELRKVLLIDYLESDYEKILSELGVSAEWASFGVVLALFNIKTDHGMEKRAFMKGVRGFFYRQDGLRLFIKGLDALLHGEVWISRDLLTQMALQKRAGGDHATRVRTALTQREAQVLTLISVGASNEEIAKKLYISTHTVKTHIYNVFKKLNVPNRLQAALWAEKNL